LLENVRWKFGSALEVIRQAWALSSKETVPVVPPALLVKFVIFVDIEGLPTRTDFTPEIACHSLAKTTVPNPVRRVDSK
jgi:hypothetical protein